MFILIDKPKGITSHDAVDKIRSITGEKRVGHAGTLDPNATGLLIIGVGRESTKKLGTISKDTEKEYEGEFYLGEERDTDDSEGVIVSKVKGFLPPTENEVRLILATFSGRQMQTPPSFSAVRIKGKKAYKLARSGVEVNLKPRAVTIYSIKLIKYKYPILNFEVIVSSGTYIRALALDVGKRLGCGAYLKNLRRLRIGDYSVIDAVKPDELTGKNWKRKAVSIL